MLASLAGNDAKILFIWCGMSIYALFILEGIWSELKACSLLVERSGSQLASKNRILLPFSMSPPLPSLCYDSAFNKSTCCKGH